MSPSDLASRFAARSDLRQSPMHALVMADIGWETIKLSPDTQLFLRRLGPVSLAKLQRARRIDLSQLRFLRKKHHIVTLYLEPKLGDPLPPSLGWHTEPFAHSATSLLDLTLPSSALLASFNQNIRRNLRSLPPPLTLTSIPLTKLSAQHITDFFALQTAWERNKHASSYPTPFLHSVLQRYHGHGHLHFAYANNVPCALLLTLYHDHVATYFIASANHAGYTLAAPTHLTWAALQLARQQGCEIFDFGGIYDPRYPRMYKGWQGFTQFKAGFRPNVVTYPATKLLLFW